MLFRSAKRLRDGITAVPGLRLLGDPRHGVIAFEGDGLDVFAVEERMKARGWHLDRLQAPAGLQMIVTPAHVRSADSFLADLAEDTAAVRDGGLTAQAGGAIYGAMITMPDRAFVKDLTLDWLDGLT